MILELNKKYTNRYVIDDDVYNNFILCSSDRNPIHIDDNFARSLGFPKKIMHGNILNALLSNFIGECLELKNIIIQSQKINFKKPFFLYDELELNATINGIYESVNTVEFKFYFRNISSNLKIANGSIFISTLL